MRNTARELNNPPPDNLPLASILDCITEVVQIIDRDWNFFYVNQSAADLAGKIALEMRGKNVWETFPELSGSSLEAACHRSMREQIRIDIEFYFSRCAKSFEIHLHPNPQYLSLYATEITRRVRAEVTAEHLAEIALLNARLQKTNEALLLSIVRQHVLTEKEVVLNARLHRAMLESHHRIKNNMQVVSALVEMQMDEMDAPLNKEHLTRIHQHVRALANVHDLLTQQVKDNVDTDTLSTQDILGRLLSMLQQTSGGRRVMAEIENVLVPAEKASALCLLVSECVSNAIKHTKGNIEVTLTVDGANARLEVCDNGPGFPPAFDWRKAANTGLSLIDSTARHDLRGKVYYQNRPEGGGCVAITFPVSAAERSREIAVVRIQE